MLGSSRGKPLELVPFSQAKPRTFSPLLCEGLTARNLSSFADLLGLYARLQQDRPDARVLASLDDLGQASYTSGHGTDYHGLDEVEGHDLSGLGLEVFENGEHQGYLSTPAEFPIRLANLLARARDIRLEAVFGFLDWETSGDANDLVTINTDPEAALGIARKQEVIFQFAPVRSAAEVIAAFPNGYFQSDLSPMQNLVLARRLEAEHGLSLFGIGARLLGFRCESALGEDRARALATELAALYAKTPPTAADELARLLTGRDWLLLRYTES